MSNRESFPAAAAKIANAGLAAGALLCMLAFAYFFYVYTLTGERTFVSWSYAALYYALPLTAAVALLASLRLRPEYRVKLLLLCSSVVISLYVLEFGLESWQSIYGLTDMPVIGHLQEVSEDKSADAARLSRQWGVDIDARSGREVLAALRRDGLDIVPVIPPNVVLIEEPDGTIRSPITSNGHELVPLSAVSNRVTLLCNENGQWVRYESDRFGFNNPDAIWQLPAIDIAVIGDSYVHGYCVPPDRNFVALIRRQRPATLNLGMAGDGPLLMLATLKEYARRAKPRVVFWCYFEGNDLENLQSERRSGILESYLHDAFTQPHLAAQDELDHALLEELPRLEATAEQRRQKARQNRRAADLGAFFRLSMLRQRTGLVGGASVDQATIADLRGRNLAVFQEVLRQADRLVKSWDGRLIFVYLPGWERYTNAWSPGEQLHADVIQQVRAIGIPIVEVDAAFAAHDDPLSLFPFRRPGHYNEKGHRVVADALITALQY